MNILKIFVDSGRTDHMVNEPFKIAVAKNENFLLAMGVGNINAISIAGNKRIDCNIKMYYMFSI